jgi:YggT family protein
MMNQLFTLIVGTAFFLYTLIVFLRFLFPLVGVDIRNPIAQFVLQATNPILNPLRKIIPPRKNIDSASLIFILLLKIVEMSLMDLISYGALNSFIVIFGNSIMSLTGMVLNFYLFAIFAQIILSWLAPYNNNPAVGILYQVTEPLMRPARKVLPPISGMDFSPIIVLLVIKVLEILLISPDGLIAIIFTQLQLLLG